MSKSNFTNAATILQACENHMTNRTTYATLCFVQAFWATDIDLGNAAQMIVDRIALLESRMYLEHGWTRHTNPDAGYAAT